MRGARDGGLGCSRQPRASSPRAERRIASGIAAFGGGAPGSPDPGALPSTTTFDATTLRKRRAVRPCLRLGHLPRAPAAARAVHGLAHHRLLVIHLGFASGGEELLVLAVGGELPGQAVVGQGYV